MLNVQLIEKTDAELDAIVADAPRQGKPEIYPPVIVELLTKYADKQGSLSFRWDEVNPDAKPAKKADKKGNTRSARDNVLANLRRVSNENKTAAGRLTFLRNADADKITCIIRKTAATK